MRLFFVLDEGIYHPAFLREFLQRTSDRVAGAVLVTKIPEKNNIEGYLLKNWRLFKPSEIAKMAFAKAGMKIGGKSVKAVLKEFKIPFFKVELDINRKQYADQIAERKPDVIVSSNPLIFGQEILKIPSICCLNRHSALLPSYRGVLPVFQAYRTGEKFVGASIHTMQKSVDKGKVLAQKKVEIKKSDTLHSLYTKCFKASVDALLEALDKVRKKDFSTVGENRPSYYSWPTEEQWKEFRERGGRII
jgi:methionyl-tRNA formyltransferase